MTVTEVISPETETTRNCRECGSEFDLPPFKIAAQFVFVCPKCSERHAEADQAELAKTCTARRLEAWAQICPPAFLDTESHKLPNPTKLEKALQWRFGARGLLLHGTTGKGKSRIAWQVLKREFLAGRSVASLDCGFGYDYASKFSIGAGEVQRYIAHKTSVDILLLDDVFKVKLTDSTEQALFAIVNRRTEYKLPIICTTNDTGDTLTARMSEDRGAALIRRLKEFSDVVTFG
jgi:hypothetical protein